MPGEALKKGRVKGHLIRPFIGLMGDGTWSSCLSVVRQVVGIRLRIFEFQEPKLCSRMIRINSEIGEKERLAARLLAAAIWFHGHKDGIDLGQGLGIVTLQDPALPGSVVLIENAEIERLLPVRSSPAPSLKCVCCFRAAC